MNDTPTLRERQAPLKTLYQADPAAARTTIRVHSVTTGNDPTKAQITADAVPSAVWDAGAHPFAGGAGDLACSGDLLLGSLAACQEITIRMVAAAMGIALDRLELSVEGDLDFRGTMGIDQDTPVGFTAIRVNVQIAAAAPPDRLQRLIQRAERYCVVAATLRQSPEITTTISTGDPPDGVD